MILRKDFKSTVARVNFGSSRYGDGTEKRASITTGFGDIDKDRYNVLLNFEVARQGEIYNRDRAGRAQIGRSDLRDLGFVATTFTGGGQGLGGTGAIVAKNAAGSSVNGNVRNPNTLDYYSRGDSAGVGFTRTFPRAACSNFTSHQQGDPNGGCLTDAAQQYGQIRPSQESVNFFGRGALQLSGDLQAYVEGNLYTNRSVSFSAPSVISSSVGSAVGLVNNLNVSLGAAHPDNPYLGTTTRLRYLAADVGPQVSTSQSTFTRFVAGIKGSVNHWDIDSALLFSQNKVTTERTGSLQRDVAFALLDPSAVNVANATAGSAAYAALPTGTLWRIAENANLNSSAMYAALSPTISNSAVSQVMQVDFKASRELGSLPGGPMGIALGTEFRRESVKLVPTTGTERGNVIGLGYSAYDGQRNVSAAFVELLAPVIRTLELSAALRADHYSDFGTSVTPKLGAKWTPAGEFALRGTYAEGFRAPGPAENGKGGVAAFLPGVDTVRCALGVGGTCAGNLLVITSPNPHLVPEKSKSYTLGLVWDPAPKTSVAVDFWQIVRKNEINHEQTADAIAAGHLVRDPSTASGIAGDPGAIVAVLASYVNSAKTTVRGVDVDMRQGFDFGGGMGRLTLDAKWTHLFTWLREEKDGSKFNFAGTHGNCDISNCMGTPADRVNLVASWEKGGLRVSTSVNYRASLNNVMFEGDPQGCASTYANGTDAPNGCRIASFTTVDLTLRWKATDKLEIFGGIQNLFDRIAPLDPLTYGATSYNPLDYSGAVGRYFNAGVKYRF